MTPAPSPALDPDLAERLARARRLIEARLDEDIPLEDLAREACFSPFHFHRLFRGLLGETVRGYTRRLRLERAAHQLTHTADDILPIALAAGYDSHEAFTRAFKARFELTPSAWRDQRREVLANATTHKEPAVDIRIERREPSRIAFVRHTGPYDQVGDAWQALMKWGWTKVIFGKPDSFGLCHDDPDITPADRVRYDACLVVDVKAKPKPPVELRDLPGGAYAVTVHAGPFDKIGETYAALCARVASNTIAGKRWTLADPPSLEKYLTDPRKTKPEDLRTEVWMPVR
jgi:AraC family transcriptional regulator